jgi:hypothetical protein
MPVSSHDLYAHWVKNIDISWMQPPNIVHDLVMYAHKPSMVWEVSLLEFILNRMVELVKNMKIYRYDFRESHMKKVVSDAFGFTRNLFLRMGFTGISVTTF